jgi:serine protease Do
MPARQTKLVSKLSLVMAALLFCLTFTRSGVAGDKAIAIDSTPEGAAVELNGSVVCTTPCALPIPKAYFGAKHTVFSSHEDQPIRIRLLKEGFVPRSVELTKGPIRWQSLNGVNSFEYYLVTGDRFSFQLDPVRAFISDKNSDSTLEQTSLPGSSGILSTEQLVKQSLPAVVQIQTASGNGSGFFISPDGLVVTNAHVVQGQQAATVVMTTGKWFQSTRIYVDRDRDVALIKTDASDTPYLRLRATLPQQGADVVAIGNPGTQIGSGVEMFPDTVTKGIVSSVREFSDSMHALLPGSAGTWIQTDAAINHGNSGGPLLDRTGKVVGINTLSMAATGTSGIFFALASPEVVRIVDTHFGVNLEALGNGAAGPKPSASSGKLNITSNPPGADIEVDGIFLGTTPADLTVDEGQHSIRVSKKGFVPYERSLKLMPDGSQTLTVDLDRK